ncbi:MAG: hypothetical protein DMD91_33745, partial [Candidatus Rokuibacteriota bacterium]
GIAILGQTLTGDLSFTERATDVQLTVANGRLDLGDGLVSVSNAAASFTITPAGIAGTFSGSVAINVPRVVVTGALAGAVDTTNPANRFVRLSGTAVALAIAGETLNGDFTLEQGTSASGERVVKVAVQNLRFHIGSGTPPFVDVSNAEGQLLVSRRGVAGSLEVNASSFALPSGIALSSGSIGIELNTIPAAVTETFEIAGQLKTLSLPAGPYVRVAVLGGQLTLGSHPALSGNFFFDRTTREDGTPLTRIAVSDLQVNVSIGGNGAALTQGEGGFVLLGGGVAGVISGKASIAAGPIQAGASILLRINTTGAAVDETIDLGGRAVLIRFGAAESAVVGGVFEVSFSGLSLNIADFLTLEGNVTFGSRTLSDGTAADVFAGEGLQAFLGRGPPKLAGGDPNPLAEGVLLSNARIGLIRIGTTYALVADGTVSLVGVNGVVLTGTAHVSINTTGLAIDETLSIPGSTSPGIVVRFSTANQVVSFEALNAQLSVAGQTLTGNFAFDHGTSVDDVRIAASNVTLDLGGGSTGPVRVVNGQGALLLTGAGIAGELSGTVVVAVSGVSVGGVFSIAVNTTAAPMSASVTVGGQTVGFDLPAGPYVRVTGINTTLTVLGQTLTGNFAFERITRADQTSAISLVVSNATFSLKADARSIVALTSGQGAFLVTSAGVAGEIRGAIALDVPGAVSLRGDFGLRINNTNAAVHERLTVGLDSFDLDLPAGPYVRVQGDGVVLTVLGQTLTGNFAFEQVTSLGANGVPGGGDDVQVVRVGATGVALALSDGATDLLTVSNASGAIFVTPTSVFGEITGAVALNVPGISVSGTLEIQLNTGAAAVQETLRVGVVPVQVRLPAGPYLRVAGTGIGLTVVGQTLSGDFAFERTLDASGHPIVHLQASNVTAGLGGNGTPVLALTGGSGNLVVTSTGTAGQLSGSVVLNVPGVSLSGTIALSVNTTAAPANGLPAGPYLRVEAGTAASAATLSVLGQQLSGRFAFEEIRNSLGQRIVRMAATGVEMSFANSMLVVHNGEGV